MNELLEPLVRIDSFTAELVVELRSPLVTKVMTSVTGLGSATAAMVFVGMFALAGWRREARSALVSLAIAGLIVGSLMLAVQRPFPADPVCVTESTAVAHSFPSGHAAAVTAFALVSRESEVLPVAVVTVLAVAVAVSRIYLGTHYLTDTVVGVLIGIGSFVIARQLLDRRQP